MLRLAGKVSETHCYALHLPQCLLSRFKDMECSGCLTARIVNALLASKDQDFCIVDWAKDGLPAPIYLNLVKRNELQAKEDLVLVGGLQDLHRIGSHDIFVIASEDEHFTSHGTAAMGSSRNLQTRLILCFHRSCIV